MEYEVRKLRDANGNLHDEIDPIRSRYAFPPFMPSGPSDNYIEIPDGMEFYMETIEVHNTDTANPHTFTIQDDNGNEISLTLSVGAGEYKVFSFYHGALSGKIHFIPDAYNTLKFKVSGLLASTD